MLVTHAPIEGQGFGYVTITLIDTTAPTQPNNGGGAESPNSAAWGMSGPAIAGAVVGGLGVLAVVGYFAFRRRQSLDSNSNALVDAQPLIQLDNPVLSVLRFRMMDFAHALHQVDESRSKSF